MKEGRGPSILRVEGKHSRHREHEDKCSEDGHIGRSSRKASRSVKLEKQRRKSRVAGEGIRKSTEARSPRAFKPSYSDSEGIA